MMNRYRFLPSYHYEDNTDGKIQSPATDQLRDYTIHGNHGKNLIPYPFAKSTTTVNGITFTDNGNGTITANGTATATAELVPISAVSNVWIKAGVTYTLSGTPSDGAYNKWYMYTLGLSAAKSDMGKSVTFTGDDTDKRLSLVLRIASGVTAENVVFKPQLEEGETATAFEKWCGVGDKTINEIPYPFSDGTKTESGITFTDNGDGSLTLNGTATPKNAYYAVWSRCDRVLDKNKKYLLTTSTTIPNTDAYLYMELRKEDGTSVATFQVAGLGYKIADLSQYEFDKAYISVVANYQKTFDNAVFKPILIDLEEQNLIPYPYYDKTDGTVSGVTRTMNADGSVTLNGTATRQDQLCIITKTLKVEKGKRYFLFGLPDKTVTSTYKIVASFRDSKGNNITYSQDVGKGVVFSGYDGDYANLWIYVMPQITGAVFDNLTLKPTLVPIDFEPHGYRIPIVNDTRENLVSYPFDNTTKTVNGLTFTDNKDGTITVNGTATITTSFYYRTVDRKLHVDGKVLISGCPTGGSTSTYSIYLNLYKIADGTTTYVAGIADTGSGAQIDCSSYDYTAMEYKITISSGTVCDNLTFNQNMIRADIDPDTTTIYTADQVMDGESISFRKNGLPAVGLSESNQLSVETAVKPSAVEYNYYTY